MLKDKGNLVGVYGTLKQGYGNYTVMQSAEGVFKGKALTKDKFIMNGYGFPYIIPDTSDVAKQVVLELFEVDERGVTHELDSLEGHPTFYKREEIPVILENGEETTAWVYIYQDTIQADESLINEDGNYEW